jgi:hypothetical protein
MRTSVILDPISDAAARDLAKRYRCSRSEAIRRAVVAHRDLLGATSPEWRRQRRQHLELLFGAFEGHDGEAEVARLKEEDGGS